jgi:hypothetical protein
MAIAADQTVVVATVAAILVRNVGCIVFIVLIVNCSSIYCIIGGACNGFSLYSQ